jgi:hypothetical protein
VRDAGQHDGAVLLYLRELARHPVEAHVDLTDLARHRRLVKARIELAFADACRCEGQLLQRLIDQAGDRRRAEHRGNQRDADPQGEGAPGHRADASRIDLQPVRVAIDREADPEARRSVHRARDQRIGPELPTQFEPIARDRRSIS